MNLETKFKYAQERYFDEALIQKNIEVADEYAIGFANWYEFMLRQNDNINEKFTAKQLIEMYKKEKGL